MSNAALLPGRQGINAWLFSPHRPMLVHWVFAGLLAYALSAASKFLLEGMLAGLGVDVASLPTRGLEPSPLFVLGAVLHAPVAETFLLAIAIWLLGRFSASPLFVASSVAALAGLAHGPNPAAVVGTGLAFFVYAVCYIAWRSVTVPKALLAAAVPHAVYNTLIMF
jgi:hypothetical protein